MVFGAHHICIKVTSIDRSRTFYEEALGFAVDSVIHHTPTITSCFMRSGDGALRIQLLSIPGQVVNHTEYGHMGMTVEAIQESFNFHQKMGVISQEIVEQTHQFGYFIKDPDGYEIELCQLKNL